MRIHTIMHEAVTDENVAGVRDSGRMVWTGECVGAEEGGHVCCCSMSAMGSTGRGRVLRF